MKYLVVLVIIAAFFFVVVWMRQPATFYRKPQPLSVIHASPDDAIPEPDKHPVPTGIAKPSLPITSSSFATDPELSAFTVRYISAHSRIEEHCLKRVMADSIPSENVLASSLDGHGNFTNLCPAQESIDYKPWPF